MQTTPLVTILTPTYNNAKIIHRLLDSVLAQSYPNIEMIIIDDGSTDDVAKVVYRYIDLFKQRGYSLEYHYQSNGGQSVAINNGLKRVKGEYLLWPDADDFYASDRAISTLVGELAASGDDVGMVRCESNLLAEESLDVVGSLQLMFGVRARAFLFMDCLLCRWGFWYQPGGYIVRMADLDRLIVGREIYTNKRAGQNWQLMLPLLHGRRCVTVRQKLYNVLVREGSHSKGEIGDMEYKLSMYNTYERTILATLNSMSSLSSCQKSYYIGAVKRKYFIRRVLFLLKKALFQ